MIAFLLKYWKIGALVVGIAILGWWHQHEVSKAYRRGATDREKSALADAAKKVEEDSAGERKAIEARRAELDLVESKIQGERAALNTARTGINSALAAGLNQIAAQGVDTRNEIQSVPDDAVNGRFRLALERARLAERERATQSGRAP